MKQIETQHGAAPRQLNMNDLLDIMSEDEVRTLIMTKKRDKILAQHKDEYPIWQNTKGRWVTYVPDMTKPYNRRQISAKAKSDLLDKVVSEYRKQDEPTRSAVTMRSLYPQWLEHKAKVTSEATADRNRTDWNRFYAKDPIIDKPMAHLTVNAIQEWVCSIKTNKEMDRTQFGNFSSIIRQMFKYAYTEGLIPDNQFAKVEIDWKEDNFYSRQEEPDEERAYYADEAEKMIEYCWEQYRKNRQRVQIFAPLAIAFTFYTGLRVGEVVALRFSDVSTKGITIQRALNSKKKVLPKPKKSSKRTLPLTDQALEVIEEVRRRKAEMGLSTNGYIFAFDSDYDGDPARLYSRIQWTIRHYDKELGLTIYSMHDIRRTFISHCAESGMSVKQIMKYAGHKHIETTENNYLTDVVKEKEKAEVLQKALPY